VQAPDPEQVHCHAQTVAQHLNLAGRIIHPRDGYLRNLVANAVESIENSGKIKLAFSHNQDRVTFHIANNGPGIPVRKQELIFEPGYTTKFDTSGNPSTGMGLPYIKDLVHSLHGKITLESSMSEMKTVFAVELPLSKIIKRGD
jgi:two-component system sensor histidine kinase YcbA